MRFAPGIRLALAAGLLLLAAGVRAQVTVGDDLHMNLDGSLAVGYFASNGNLVQSTHSLSVGGEADLHGDYLDPRVINFVVSPYYNLSRANSSIQSIFDASGVNASTQILQRQPLPWLHQLWPRLESRGQFRPSRNRGLQNTRLRSVFQRQLESTSSRPFPRCRSAMESATATTRCSAPTPGGIAIPGFSACIAAINCSGFNLMGGYSDFKLTETIARDHQRVGSVGWKHRPEPGATGHLAAVRTKDQPDGEPEQKPFHRRLLRCSHPSRPMTMPPPV